MSQLANRKLNGTIREQRVSSSGSFVCSFVRSLVPFSSASRPILLFFLFLFLSLSLPFPPIQFNSSNFSLLVRLLVVAVCCLNSILDSSQLYQRTTISLAKDLGKTTLKLAAFAWFPFRICSLENLLYTSLLLLNQTRIPQSQTLSIALIKLR